MMLEQWREITLCCREKRTYRYHVCVVEGTGLAYHKDMRRKKCWTITHIKSGRMLCEVATYTAEQARAWIEKICTQKIDDHCINWNYSFPLLCERYGKERLRAFLLRAHYEIMIRRY